MLFARREELRTELGLEEVTRRLRAVTERPRRLRPRWRERLLFEGEVGIERFRLTRVRRYVFNSYTPIVFGTAEADAGGTTLRLHLRPPVPVIVFSDVWLATAALIFVMGVATAVLVEPDRATALLFAAGVLVFALGGLAFMVGAFVLDARSSVATLRKLLDAA
jgi:hypothetical protein